MPVRNSIIVINNHAFVINNPIALSLRFGNYVLGVLICGNFKRNINTDTTIDITFGLEIHQSTHNIKVHFFQSCAV